MGVLFSNLESTQMKKPVLLSLILFSLTFSSHGQGTEVTLDNAQLTLSFVPLMAHVELKLAESQSVTFGGGLGYSVYYENVNGEESFEAFTSPFFTSSYRSYYKRKRVKKDNLKNNSGNYVGVYSFYGFKTLLTDNGETFLTDFNSFAIGPVWGFQRNYASGLHLDLSLGLGYLTGQSNEFFGVDDQITFLGGFELGFRLDL